MPEQILVFPTKSLTSFTSETGFLRHDSFSLAMVPRSLYEFRDRDLMEQDQNFLQLIPYVVLRHVDKDTIHYLSYSRHSSGGEERLHAKTSVGLGGHINLTDCFYSNQSDDVIDLTNTISEAVLRELGEELPHIPEIVVSLEAATIAGSVIVPYIHGYIYDPSNDVGKVHFGLVYVFDVRVMDDFHDCESQKDFAWKTKQQLLQMPGLENWSKLYIQSTPD